jgi:hypothetical protein
LRQVRLLAEAAGGQGGSHHPDQRHAEQDQGAGDDQDGDGRRAQFATLPFGLVGASRPMWPCRTRCASACACIGPWVCRLRPA